jgi:Domain of unknown function (DUF4136)
MRRTTSRLTIWLAAAAFAAGLPTVLMARVKVQVNYDKKFDFKPARTWAWNPSGAGQIMMARTADDDKEAARKMAEPIILEGVASELAKRGLTAATGQPDLTVTYYLLLTSGVNAQYMGQFLSATPEWGLPPFPPATQSFKATNNGALVIDFNARNDIVWRGVAQAQLDIGIDLKKREAVLREGIRDLIKRFPPK